MEIPPPNQPKLPVDAGLQRRSASPERGAIEAPRLRLVEPSPRPGLEAGVPASKGGFTDKAVALAQRALKGLAGEVSRAFEAVGLDGGAGKALVQGFAEPLLQAIREGADVIARFRLVAAESTRLVTESGVSESLSLFAKSVEISVDHDSGEIAVAVQSLSIEQDSVIAFRSGPLEAAAPAAAPDLLSFLDSVLPEAVVEEEKSETVSALQVRPFDPPLEIVTPRLVEKDGEGGTEITRSRILLHALEQSRGEAGERLTKLRLDAQIVVTRQLEPRQLDLGAEATPVPPPKPGLDLSV